MNRKLLLGASAAPITILIVALLLPTPYPVARVIDGDTLVLENGERIRLLGIDTPERGEPLFAEARDHLSSLVDGKPIFLETGHEDRDKYGRLLRWVRVDGKLANLDLIANGLARTFMLEETDAYYRELLEAERSARAAGLGTWKGRNETLPPN